MNGNDFCKLISLLCKAGLSFEGEIYINNALQYVNFSCCLSPVGDVVDVTICTRNWLSGFDKLVCTIRDFEGTVIDKQELGQLDFIN